MTSLYRNGYLQFSKWQLFDLLTTGKVVIHFEYEICGIETHAEFYIPLPAAVVRRAFILRYIV